MLAWLLVHEALHPSTSHSPSASTPTACSCDNGAGTVFPSQLCTLKQQPTGSDGRPSLDSYGSGPGVPWTSGYLA